MAVCAPSRSRTWPFVVCFQIPSTAFVWSLPVQPDLKQTNKEQEQKHKTRKAVSRWSQFHFSLLIQRGNPSNALKGLDGPFSSAPPRGSYESLNNGLLFVFFLLFPSICSFNLMNLPGFGLKLSDLAHNELEFVSVWVMRECLYRDVISVKSAVPAEMAENTALLFTLSLFAVSVLSSNRGVLSQCHVQNISARRNSKQGWARSARNFTGETFVKVKGNFAISTIQKSSERRNGKAQVPQCK